MSALALWLWNERRHLDRWGSVVLIAGLAGLAVRFTAPGRLRAVLTGIGVVAALMPMVETFGAESELIEVLDYLITLIPWLLLASLAVSPRRRLSFALGFLVVVGPPYLPLAAFLVARDVGRSDFKTPSRQHFALIGTGLLAGVFAYALAFDLGATLTYDTLGMPAWGTRHLDATFPRWMRMATETGIVASCFAQSRGRTWGLVGLLVLLPAFYLQLTLAEWDLPYWSSGCVGGGHPFWRQIEYLWITLVATGPWLWPVLRSLLPERSLREV